MRLAQAPLCVAREIAAQSPLPQGERGREAGSKVRSDMTGENDEMRRALRFGADMICLWRLCDQAECRRARACQGDAGQCGGRIAEWLEAIDQKRAAEPDFFSIEMRLETREAFRAYRAWREALAHVLRGASTPARSTAYLREELMRKVVALRRTMADERPRRVGRNRSSEKGGKG